MGAGAEVNLDVGFDDWTFSFDGGLGAYLGVGAEFDVGFEVDVVALGGGLIDLGKDIWGWTPWG